MKSEKTFALIISFIFVLLFIVGFLFYLSLKNKDFPIKYTEDKKEEQKNEDKKDNLPLDDKINNYCVIDGCNGEVCRGVNDEPINSMCIALPKMVCYQNAECKVQSNGKCGWTQTRELLSCLASKEQSNDFIDEGLLTAHQSYANGVISECTENGNKYYSAGLNAYDGGGKTFDVNGNVVGEYQGFSGVYTGINPQNCEKIYSVYPNIWGYPSINKYNLK